MRILRNAQFRGIITHMLNIRVLNKLALVTVVAVAATLFWEDGLSVEAQAAPTQYAWTFETVAHAGPIEGTCTPDTRVTGLGFGTGGAPVVGWRDTSGCIPADLPENFPNRWATKEDSRWRTYEIGENVHGAGRGSTFQRGTPALSVAEDGTPYMLYPGRGSRNLPRQLVPLHVAVRPQYAAQRRRRQHRVSRTPSAGLDPLGQPGRRLSAQPAHDHQLRQRQRSVEAERPRDRRRPRYMIGRTPMGPVAAGTTSSGSTATTFRGAISGTRTALPTRQSRYWRRAP